MNELGKLKKVADLAFAIHLNTVRGKSDGLVMRLCVEQIQALQEAGYDLTPIRTAHAEREPSEAKEENE